MVPRGGPNVEPAETRNATSLSESGGQRNKHTRACADLLDAGPDLVDNSSPLDPQTVEARRWYRRVSRMKPAPKRNRLPKSDLQVICGPLKSGRI